MTTYARPAVDDVYRVLRERNGLVVHFSGCPKGSGGKRENHLYPHDLAHVVNGLATGGISCSVVMPGDRFHGYNNNHAVGTVGVVVGFSSPQSLLQVCAGDCGSSEVTPGVRATSPWDMPLSLVEQSIESRRLDGYNEWVVANYKPLGIFVAEPVTVTRLKKFEIEGQSSYLSGTEALPDYGNESLPAIRGSFPDMRIFTFENGAIQELHLTGWSPVPHTEIYVWTASH